MAIILVLIAAVIFGLFVYHLWFTNSYSFKMVEKLHGVREPHPIPILGNSHIFSPDSAGNYKLLLKFCAQNPRLFRVWLGREPYVFGYTAQDAESILSSTTHITKSDAYKFTLPWIGTGLLTSTGPKWKSRRRIITPTFHFKILEDFVDVFQANSEILVKKLFAYVDQSSFDVYPHCNLFALDNICETAMGVHINAQLDSNSKYVQAIKDMCKIVNVRVYQPWLGPDLIFNLSKYGKMQRNALSIIHHQTTTTIRERRSRLQDNETEKGRKLAFLDLLLQSESNLFDEEIREEVDTFMFEGHDTVTSGLSFCLYLLSKHPAVQEKAYQEQCDIMGGRTEPISYKDYQDMKYLERVLKETQRLYPSVPIIGRYMHNNLRLSDGVILPKGVQMNLILPVLHRSPLHWTDPESFNPDNFLTDASATRHPYAYVPFSAGPRNCIGQKFAMLEMKACVSAVLRNFTLLPCEPDKNVEPVAEIVLLSKTGVNIRLSHRK